MHSSFILFSHHQPDTFIGPFHNHVFRTLCVLYLYSYGPLFFNMTVSYLEFLSSLWYDSKWSNRTKNKGNERKESNTKMSKETNKENIFFENWNESGTWKLPINFKGVLSDQHIVIIDLKGQEEYRGLWLWIYAYDNFVYSVFLCFFNFLPIFRCLLVFNILLFVFTGGYIFLMWIWERFKFFQVKIYPLRIFTNFIHGNISISILHVFDNVVFYAFHRWACQCGFVGLIGDNCGIIWLSWDYIFLSFRCWSFLGYYVGFCGKSDSRDKSCVS